nr:multicopper oxidase family protein [uncultured Lichenicoccus sp.]
MRRQLLLAPLAMLAAGLVLGPAALLVPRVEQSVAVGPATLPGELTVLRSRHGVLEVTLRASSGPVHLGVLTLSGATYNGLYAGPVLRLHPGDLLRVRLLNLLSQPTNLHFHGMQGSPLGNGDNAHLAVPPGGSFLYEIVIAPTQPPGLYWYHSHQHGQAEAQVMGGLSGALVIDPLAAGAPALVGKPGMPAERLLVLKDMEFQDDTGDPRIDDDLHGLVQSVNGRLEDDSTMRPGETQLWRFSNQSANRAFHLSLQAHRFRIVAVDGGRLVATRDADRLDIMPGSRIDALVDAGVAGRYLLLSEGAMAGVGAARRLDRSLGTLLVAGATMPASVSLPDPAPPRDLRPLPLDARRIVTFSQQAVPHSETLHYFINLRMFDARRIDFRIPLGNVEEWTIRNDSDDMHVFHIHQLGFQVTAINGVAVPFSGRIDNVRIPERGEVTVRMAFTDPLILGRFMFHCHVLRHEDGGMMGQVEVYDPQPASPARRLHLAALRIWWWLHGVPWEMCVAHG